MKRFFLQTTNPKSIATFTPKFMWLTISSRAKQNNPKGRQVTLIVATSFAPRAARLNVRHKSGVAVVKIRGNGEMPREEREKDRKIYTREEKDS
jgi:hypothetical protein